MSPHVKIQRSTVTTRPILSWAFYDWANSAFATTVMAGFFPIYFKTYWSAGIPVTESTFRLGLANSLGGIVIMLLAPLLGAIADQGSARKRFLLFFTVMGVVMTGALFFVGQGMWVAAVLIYVVAVMGFAGSNIFYDALIVVVSPREKYDVVSALGYALGYLGGGLLFALNVAMVLWPQSFGLVNEAQAIQVSFVIVAMWWAVFSLPVTLFVKEPPVARVRGVAEIIGSGVRQLWSTFHRLRRLRMIWLFLLAYWFYIDAVDTIIRMAVDYGMSLGFDANTLIVALLITQFVGFPAALVFGKLGERYGPKTGIFLAIVIYSGITLWAMVMDRVIEFYVLAVAIGLVQGGIQSLSRSLYASMIPPDKAAEYFGFYNMLGKFAVVLGPILMGGVGVVTGSTRTSLLAVLVLLIVGAAMLFRVDARVGRDQALRDSATAGEVKG